MECWALQFGLISGYLRAHLPVASHHFEFAVVSSEGDVESHDGLAGLDEVQPLGVDSRLRGAGLEEHLHLLEEARLAVGVQSLVLGGRSGGEGSSLED